MHPYWRFEQRQDALEAELAQMLEDGVIEEGESAPASPVVLVPKKNDNIRVCVDYRRMNVITVPDRYLLPSIDDVLHAAKTSL